MSTKDPLKKKEDMTIFNERTNRHEIIEKDYERRKEIMKDIKSHEGVFVSNKVLECMNEAHKKEKEAHQREKEENRRLEQENQRLEAEVAAAKAKAEREAEIRAKAEIEALRAKKLEEEAKERAEVEKKARIQIEMAAAEAERTKLTVTSGIKTNSLAEKFDKLYRWD